MRHFAPSTRKRGKGLGLSVHTATVPLIPALDSELFFKKFCETFLFFYSYYAQYEHLVNYDLFGVSAPT